MRLCFFVKVLNARGRSVGGGSIIGRTAGLRAGGAGIGAVRSGRAGLTGGVAKAGDDEGTGSEAGSMARRLIEAIMGELVVETCGGAGAAMRDAPGDASRKRVTRGAALGCRNISARPQQLSLTHPQLAPAPPFGPPITTNHQ